MGRQVAARAAFRAACSCVQTLAYQLMDRLRQLPNNFYAGSLHRLRRARAADFDGKSMFNYKSPQKTAVPLGRIKSLLTLEGTQQLTTHVQLRNKLSCYTAWYCGRYGQISNGVADYRRH